MSEVGMQYEGFTYKPKIHIKHYVSRMAMVLSTVCPGMYANMGENGEKSYHKILFIHKDEERNRTFFMERVPTPEDMIDTNEILQ